MRETMEEKTAGVSFRRRVEVPWLTWEAPSSRRRPHPAPSSGGRRRWGLRRGVQPGQQEWEARSREVGASTMSWKTLLRELSLRCDGGVTSSYGIDLNARGGEVRKLFFAGGYHRSVLREGLDPEEALQEVYRGLCIRNQGRCPWDATKSSFGHYVHIVIRCVLSNYLRKERRRNQREFLATEDREGELRVTDGVTEAEENGSAEFLRRQVVAAGLGSSPFELEGAVALVRGLEEGRPRREVCAELGRSLQWAEDLLRQLRTSLSHLRNESS